jgi:hypothetical protein
MIVLGNSREHIKKVGSEEKTALVSSSLPAWFKNDEMLESLLSHLVTSGRNSYTFGFVKPKGKPT